MNNLVTKSSKLTGKTRMNLDLNEKAAKRLEYLTEFLETDSKSSVIRIALKMYEHIVKQVREGDKVFAGKDKDSAVEQQLFLGTLEGELKRSILDNPIHAFVGIDSMELEIVIVALLKELADEKSIRRIAFEPHGLRAPCPRLGPDDKLRISPTGFGLASSFEQISLRDPKRCEAIKSNINFMFPIVQEITTRETEDGLLELELELSIQKNPRIPASHISNGMLCCLGYAVLSHLAPKPITRISNPEHSLHPEMISEVMEILEDMSLDGKVWITTASPFVLDHLEAHQISVLKASADGGTELELLCDTPEFEKKRGVYNNGDYWVSCCSKYGYFR